MTELLTEFTDETFSNLRFFWRIYDPNLLTFHVWIDRINDQIYRQNIFDFAIFLIKFMIELTRLAKYFFGSYETV